MQVYTLALVWDLRTVMFQLSGVYCRRRNHIPNEAQLRVIFANVLSLSW